MGHPTLFIICLCTVCGCSLLTEAHEYNDFPKLILVSFDGFRWDYLNNISKEEVPHFTFLRQNGSWAKEGIQNAYITKTLPNHFTLLTSWYVESHGMVGNHFYDPEFKEVFSQGNVSQLTDPKWFKSEAEPIWLTNQKSKNERRSGSMMWPGDGVGLQGYLPSKYIFYNRNTSFYTRVDIMVSWFLTHQDPINLGLLYFDEPDHTGHEFGPNSPNITEKVKELDKLLGYLVQKLKDSELWEEMNLIVTSDHGMAETPADKVINLDDHVDPSLYRTFLGTPVADIWPVKGKEQEVYDGFKKFEHLKVYWKKEVPEEYHYRDNPRIMPIILEADLHYSLSHNNSTEAIKGNHGYNNSVPEMHPIFMAYGPAFKNVAVKTFNNVDIYPMMCYILGIEPAPNNGSLDRVTALLQPREEGGGISIAYFVLIPIVLCVAAIISVAACRQRRFQRLHRVPAGPMGYPVDKFSVSTSLISESEDDEDLGLP